MHVEDGRQVMKLELQAGIDIAQEPYTALGCHRCWKQLKDFKITDLLLKKYSLATR